MFRITLFRSPAVTAWSVSYMRRPRKGGFASLLHGTLIGAEPSNTAVVDAIRVGTSTNSGQQLRLPGHPCRPSCIAAPNSPRLTRKHMKISTSPHLCTPKPSPAHCCRGPSGSQLSWPHSSTPKPQAWRVTGRPAQVAKGVDLPAPRCAKREARPCQKRHAFPIAWDTR